MMQVLSNAHNHIDHRSSRHNQRCGHCQSLSPSHSLRRPFSGTALGASAAILVVALLWGGGLAGCDGATNGEDPVDPLGVCPTEWRVYPYHPQGTDIRFPDDEGAHYPADREVTMEWWYTIYHLTAEDGREYSVMATFFMPQIEIAYRPFNITDVASGEMYDTDEWGTLEAEVGPLSLHWTSENPDEPPSTFFTRRSCGGDLVPFGYEQDLHYLDPADPARSQRLHLRIDAEKSPYIVAGDGYVTIGDSGESYYYSLTQLRVEGELELNGETLQVTGFGWMDHQWGPFMLHPLSISKNSYEWMALHLDNGDQYMVSVLFDQQNRTHPELGFGSVGWKLADCTQGITLDYTIERLAYWQQPETGYYYSHLWRLSVPETELDVIIEPVIEDQTVRFFHTSFYEGRSAISGTLAGETITGLAFAELVHHYEAPELEILTPTADATATAPLEVSWTVTNPDDGLPLTFEATLSDDTRTETLCADVTERSCTATDPGMSGPVTLQVTGSSTDGLITGSAAVDLHLAGSP